MSLLNQSAHDVIPPAFNSPSWNVDVDREPVSSELARPLRGKAQRFGKIGGSIWRFLCPAVLHREVQRTATTLPSFQSKVRTSMFRHGSQRDERRRRSLVEDSSADLDSSAPAKTRSRSTKSAETYTEFARADNHARWSDYVPRRNWVLATLLVVGMSVIAGLEVSYYFAARSTIWSLGSLGALDLERTNSIAGWLAALTLFSTAVDLAVDLFRSSLPD